MQNEIDVRQMNPLNIAFVGDSLLEHMVRDRLVRTRTLQPGRLNAEKVKYVSARAQYREWLLLEPLLSEQELEFFKRGRNASKASVAKHATPEEYRASTGIECLFGWLHLTGQTARIAVLFDIIWTQLEPEKK